MEKDKVISFEKEFTSLSENTTEAINKAGDVKYEVENTSDMLREIKETLSNSYGVEVPTVENDPISDEDVKPLNIILDDISDPRLRGDFCLSAVDTLVGITAGVIASIIDIVFVGTPEVVKIYKGGENFDGSILTAALRKIGNGDDQLSSMLEWLSHKCKVPYDISVQPGVVTPNNHRLRNFAHDPMIGLMFATADIVLGTATMVDANGKLCVLVNSKEYPQEEKLLAVVYYTGHLLSDVCTARGLPVPGFITTQFFAGDGSYNSIASISERMYKDGYDLRHLASMSVPVFIKNLITDAYLYLTMEDEHSPVRTIADREIRENQKLAYKYRMRLVSDAVSCGGNALKFFLPPTLGNMTALNLPEWVSLIKDTIAEAKYQLRDKHVELALFNREILSDNWDKLLDDEKLGE